MAEALASVQPQGAEFGTPAQVVGWIQRLEGLDADVKDASRDRKDFLEELAGLIGKDGVVALQRARKDATLAGETREKRERGYRFVMAAQGKPIIGVQGDLFQDAAKAEMDKALKFLDLQRVKQEGFDSGRGGRPRGGNPWTPGTEAYQAWDGEWIRGQAELAAGSDTEPKRRGRPPGAKDTKPRKPRLVHDTEKQPDDAA